MNSAALQDRRVWIGGGVLLAVVLVAASWFLLISPERSSASDLRSQAANTDVQNSVMASKNAKLAKQNANIKGLRAKLVKAVDSLPPTSGLPEFTREATAFAKAAGVKLTGITIGGVSSVSGVAAPTTPDTSGEDSTATPAPSPTASSPTPAPGGVVTTTASGQYSISVTLVSQGSLVHQLTFLHALEVGPRRVLVTSTQMGISASSRISSVDASTSMTAQLNIFSAPMSASQLASLNKLLSTTG